MNRNNIRIIILKMNLVLLTNLNIFPAATTFSSEPRTNITITGKDPKVLGLQLIEAITYSIEVNNKTEVERLIKAGANIDTVDESGDTALIEAARLDRKDIAKLLIDAGANLDIVNKSGNTALITAVLWTSERTVKLLIDAGANLDVVNKDGDTALTIANRYHFKDTVQMLEAESQRRALAYSRRADINENIKQIAVLPPVLIPIIDSYLPTDLKSILADYEESETLKEIEKKIR